MALKILNYIGNIYIASISTVNNEFDKMNMHEIGGMLDYKNI